MFGIFGKAKPRRPIDPIEAVYLGLGPYEKQYRLAGLKVSYRRIAPPELVSQLFSLSNDVATTVQLVRVLQQRQFAEGMKASLSVESMIDEAGEERALAEAEDFYQTGKAFCDETIGMMEAGQIHSTDAVRNFLDENLTAILAAYSTLKFGFYRNGSD